MKHPSSDLVRKKKKQTSLLFFIYYFFFFFTTTNHIRIIIERCAKWTSREYLNDFVANNNGLANSSLKNTTDGRCETAIEYLRRQKQIKTKNYQLKQYDNPMLTTLCLYFAILSNHRFYKHYKNKFTNVSIAKLKSKSPPLSDNPFFSSSQNSKQFHIQRV
ncbi:hypothetical protein RFI_15522, partial [Reticulomyxa filosa]